MSIDMFPDSFIEYMIAEHEKDLRAHGPKRASVDHCSCPPDHPAHQKSLRTSENQSTVVA